MSRTKPARKRTSKRPRRTVPAQAAEGPPMPQVLRPPEALHEIAVNAHRANLNLLAIAKIEGERLSVERERLELERQRLEVERELLALTRAGRAEVEQMRAQGESSTRILEQLIGAFVGRAPAEAHVHTSPALGSGAPPAPAGAGLVVSGPGPQAD